jgi:hypothetical protein
MISCRLKHVDLGVFDFQINSYNSLMSICVLKDLIWYLLRWKCLLSCWLKLLEEWNLVFTSSFLHFYREVCGVSELNWCTWPLKLIFHFCWRSVFLELPQNNTDWRFLMSDSFFMGRNGSFLDEITVFWRSSFLFFKDPLRETLSLPGSQTSLIRRVQ